MKILYIDDEETLKAISYECKDSSVNDITLVDDPLNALTFLKNSNINDFDLIVTDVSFKNIDKITYLKNLRDINKFIPLIITSYINLQEDEISTFNINKFIQKPICIDTLKNSIIELEKDIINYERYQIKELKDNKNNLEKSNLELKALNDELNSFLKPFKEFSYYSETDLKGNITDISDSFCELIGYKKEELIGKSHSIIKHPKEESSKFKDLWETVSQGNIWTGELMCLDRNANDIYYKTIIFPKKNKDEKIIGYAAKRQDITDKKYLEKLLKNLTNNLV